jgi:hypothetical protein
MFDSLDDRIKQDDRQELSARERWIRWAGIAILSVLLFGGLYVGVRALG